LISHGGSGSETIKRAILHEVLEEAQDLIYEITIQRKIHQRKHSDRTKASLKAREEVCAAEPSLYSMDTSRVSYFSFFLPLG
jgi:hypothetical protein